MSDPSARFERVLSLVARPRAHLAVIGLALLLLAPSLATGLVLDDYVFAVKARSDATVAGLPSDPLWLFTFTTGDPERNRALMEEGVLLPWWSEPRHLNAFFRPLTSLTHVLDFALWPGAPWLMHLHSMLWYALLLLVLHRVYRTIEPDRPQLLALAFTLFALNDAHGATVGWIANRNAIIAVTLALPALQHFHAAARGSRLGAWLGPIWFAVALTAGETAVSVGGYLLAYALFMDRRTLARRAWALAPYAALLLAHRGIYRIFGLGSFGSSSYRDPLREPFEFIVTLAYNLPVLVSSELLLPLADFAFWGAHAARAPLWLFAVSSLVLVAPLVIDAVRDDARTRFWCAGLCLSAIPVSASLPTERLLLVLGIGAYPLLSRLLLPLADRARALASGPRAKLLGAMLVLHGVVSPLGLPLRAAAMDPLGQAIERLDAGIPSGPEVRDRTVVIVNAPIVVMASYLQVARAARGAPRPAQLLLLSSSSSELALQRTGPASLRVELEHGFLHRLEETHYRADRLAGVEEVELRGLRATVVERTGDGRPKAVQFELAHPLESPRNLLLVYRDGRLVPWEPPPLGETERLPAQDFFVLVLRELLP